MPDPDTEARSAYRLPAMPLILAVAAMLLIGGCKTPRVLDQPVLIDAPGPLAIDVDTFSGDVVINTNPTLSQVRVRVVREALHGSGRRDEAKASLDDISWDAVVRPGELGRVLEVRTLTANAERYFQRAHVYIDAPDVDGLIVRTTTGRVFATNVRGEIDIVTSGGDVRFMTDWPMTRAVTIVNSDGDIDYRVRGESTGRFDCTSAGGVVDYRAMIGEMIVHGGTTHDTLLADLNGGGNLVTLRTVAGDIRVAVTGDPTDVGQFIVQP